MVQDWPLILRGETHCLMMFTRIELHQGGCGRDQEDIP